MLMLLLQIGCLMFAPVYVKNYINKKKNELGFLPPVFYYNRSRFQLVSLLKFVDFILGIGLWVSLVLSSFYYYYYYYHYLYHIKIQASRSNFIGLQSDFKVFLGLNLITLIITG